MVLGVRIIDWIQFPVLFTANYLVLVSREGETSDRILVISFLSFLFLSLVTSHHQSLFFLSRLEKEYTTIKNKEMEEQIEIKVCLRSVV